MKINRKKLLTCLTNIKPGLANKENIEQTTSFVFKNGRAYTFNNEIAISHPVHKKLSGAVLANELYSILSKHKEDELDIEITKNEFLIQGKRSQAGIALEAKISMPIEEIGKPSKWKPLPTNFIEAIDFSHFSAGKDLSKPEFTYLHIAGDYIEACDAFRITRYRLKTSFPHKGSVLLPAETAKLLVKFNPVEFSVTEGWIHFATTEDTIFSCRTGTGEYPSLSMFTSNKGKEIEFPDNFIGILEKAEVFATNAFENDDADDTSVQISLQKNKMVIESTNEVGWFEETVKTNYAGPDHSFEADPAFLIKMIPIAKSIYLIQDAGKRLEDCGILEFKGKNFQHCFPTAIKTNKKKR